MRDKILYCKFGTSGIGLCNQLYSLVNAMVVGSISDGHTLIIVDDFMGDLNSNQYHDAATIMDFGRINKMAEEYGVTLLSKHDIKMTSIKVEYGLAYKNKVADITEMVMARFYTHNRIRIPRGTSLNSLLGYDPCERRRKLIYFTYTINGKVFYETRDEVIDDEDLEIDFVNLEKKQWLSLTGITDCKTEIETFNHFLNHMYFNPIYEEYATKFLEKAQIEGGSKLNVIHLRVEEDAIPFWAGINRISCQEYEGALVTQYIQAIKQNIEPEDGANVILSMNTSNEVTKWMAENKYKTIQMDKTMVKGREVNAIIDLIISTRCNNVFIGNLNPINYHGSTFSYAIFNALRNKPVRKICIDNDEIYHPAYVV